MIPRTRRVTTSLVDFIIKNGRVTHGRFTYIRYVKDGDIALQGRLFPQSLFSIIVPKSVEKTSVGRHRLKRKVAHALEKILIDAKPGIAALIFVKKQTEDATTQEIVNDIQSKGVL